MALRKQRAPDFLTFVTIWYAQVWVSGVKKYWGFFGKILHVFRVITVLIFVILTFTQRADYFHFSFWIGVKPGNEIAFHYFYHGITVCLKPITCFVRNDYSKVVKAHLFLLHKLVSIYFNIFYPLSLFTVKSLYET